MVLLKDARCSLDLIRKSIAVNAFIYRKPSASILAEISSAESRLSSESGPISELDGRLVAVKDNICTKDIPTTCGSYMLDGFNPPYDATVVSELYRQGVIVVGKTNMDEFGMGSHSVNGASGPVRMPDPSQSHYNSAGGSSGGSAAAVALRMCFAALGSDTGGSVRLPAAYCGIVGLKPSYGRLSRRGLVPYANSLDTIGVLARNVEDTKLVFDHLDAYDDKDPSSLDPKPRSRIRKLVSLRGNRASDILRVGIPKELNTIEMSGTVRDAWKRTVSELQVMGHIVQSVSLPSIRQALPAYYVLAPAEASSNLAKYDGFRYGAASGVQNPSEISSTVKDSRRASQFFKTNRANGFGAEVRRRILLGTYSLSAEAFDNYFIQAQKVRRLLIKDFDRVFAFPNVLSSVPARDRLWMDHSQEGVDFLLCPSTMTTAPSLDQALSQLSSPLENYVNDYFTVPASMAGIPATTVPVRPVNPSQDIAPVGLQIITQYGDEDMLFLAANIIEHLGS